MAKKRKAARQTEAPSGPRDYDAKDARLTVNTFADIADEQEEYFLDQDKISLDDERGTKRQRQQQVEDEFLDLSDDEVFGRDADDSANESDEDGGGARRKQKKKEKKAKAKKLKAERAAKMAEDDDDDDDDNDEAKAAGGEDDSGWWGSSKEHYYDGDVVETEDGAMEEEMEARRLQKKQLSRMKASDFFDADEWADDSAAAAAAGQTTSTDQDASASASASAAGAVTMTIMSKSEIDSMTGEERYKLLQEHYPELDHLCDEFSTLEPLISKYKELAVGKAADTLETTQFRALSCYVATIALYFSVLMSPSRDDPSGPRYVMDPDELHNHEVMEYLVVARNNWEWVKRVQARRAGKEQKQAASTKGLLDTIPEKETKKTEKTEKTEKKDKKEKKEKNKAEKLEEETTEKTKEKKTKKVKKTKVSQELEDSLADLANLIPKGKKAKKAKAIKNNKADADADADSDHSDLGEEETMDARTAEEKLKRKKSLGFYTSQIMQKSSMRSGATGQAGGDVDIPYRERLRDRQERLHAAAVRRGLDAEPNELGGSDEDDDGDGADADDKAADRDANLSYYDSIVNAHKEKMAAKAARKAETEAMKLDRVTPAEWADQDGRRQLTWEIAKNKGLSHRTLKEKKNNPRVKKRIKFEKKKKQLASMRATYKPMNPSDYKGERTGIKTGLIRSIKLD